MKEVVGVECLEVFISSFNEGGDVPVNKTIIKMLITIGVDVERQLFIVGEDTLLDGLVRVEILV